MNDKTQPDTLTMSQIGESNTLQEDSDISQGKIPNSNDVDASLVSDMNSIHV